MKRSSIVEEFLSKIIKDVQADPSLRERLIKNPKEVVESRINFKLPEDVEISVHEDTPRKLNIVLPHLTDELSEVELEAVAGGCYAVSTDVPDDCNQYGYNCPSDNKLKVDIADIGSALNRIMRIKF